MTGSWRWTPASDPADFWLGWNSLAPQVFPSSMTAWQLTTGPERQFTCGPRVSWKERLRRGFEGTPPGFPFLLLFFPFFVRALILGPLSRVMGNVYVFSRMKATSSGPFWLCFLPDCKLRLYIFLQQDVLWCKGFSAKLFKPTVKQFGVFF